MKYFVQYHNTELMGCSAADYLQNDLFIVTDKNLPDVKGSTVWLFSGEGKNKRQYSIAAVFIALEILDTHSGEFRYIVRGTKGRLIKPPIEVTDKDWFPDFLDSQKNFHFGLNEIDQKFVQILEELAPIQPKK